MASIKTSPTIKKHTPTPSSSSSSSSLSSAEAVASNDNLLIEILLRLPITSLLSFKSVSKHWLSLISTPCLCHRHTLFCRRSLPSGLYLPHNQSHRINNPELYYFINLNNHTTSQLVSSKFMSFPNNHPTSGLNILHSCNGLLLCCTSGLDQITQNYYVYNPTIEYYTTLPPLLAHKASTNCKTGFSLAFDPLKIIHYRVVCVVENDSVNHVQIYSSQTGSWRLCSVSFPSNFGDNEFKFDGGVFWNGALHWLSSWDGVTSWGTKSGLYLVVDVDGEEEHMNFRDMPLPPIPEDWEWDDANLDYFGESGDHLHLVGYEPSYTHFDVYEMERDYSGWFVKFRVELDEVSNAFPQMIPSQEYGILEYSVILVARFEADEDSYLVVKIDGALIKYYLNTNTFEKLCDIDHDVDTYDNRAYQYIESLATV